MNKYFIFLFFTLGVVCASAQPANLGNDITAQLVEEQTPGSLKIVFQLSINDTMAHKALMKQLGNITSVEPAALIEIVCHGPGLEMLHRTKSTVASKVDYFTQKGVIFNACEFSMKERNVMPDEIIPSAKFVKAGIIYIARKQSEGWAYIKSGF
jgi:uncharacterized protein